MAQRSVKVYQVDVFTETLFAGNPAGVVLGAEILTEAEMQALFADLPAALAKRPTIFVGEPGSLPFEQARLSGRASRSRN